MGAISLYGADKEKTGPMANVRDAHRRQYHVSTFTQGWASVLFFVLIHEYSAPC